MNGALGLHQPTTDIPRTRPAKHRSCCLAWITALTSPSSHVGPLNHRSRHRCHIYVYYVIRHQPRLFRLDCFANILPSFTGDSCFTSRSLTFRFTSFGLRALQHHHLYVAITSLVPEVLGDRLVYPRPTCSDSFYYHNVFLSPETLLPIRILILFHLPQSALHRALTISPYKLPTRYLFSMETLPNFSRTRAPST